MTTVTRIAPVGARFAAMCTARPATGAGPASALDVALACSRAGRKDLAAGFLQQGATMAAVRAALVGSPRLSTPAETAEAQGGLPAPRPDEDRLTALENRVGGLEARTDRIEATLKLPPIDQAADPAQGGAAPSASAAVQPRAAIDTTAIYARMNGRTLQAAVPRAADGGLDAAAINRRHGKMRAARAEQMRQPARAPFGSQQRRSA